MRTGFQNRPDVVYNPDDLTTLFAEDIQALVDAVGQGSDWIGGDSVTSPPGEAVIAFTNN